MSEEEYYKITMICSLVDEQPLKIFKDLESGENWVNSIDFFNSNKVVNFAAQLNVKYENSIFKDDDILEFISGMNVHLCCR